MVFLIKYVKILPLFILKCFVFIPVWKHRTHSCCKPLKAMFSLQIFWAHSPCAWAGEQVRQGSKFFTPQHHLSNGNVEQCISKRAEENLDFSDQALVHSFSALMLGVSPSILHHHQNCGFHLVSWVISFRQMRWRVSRNNQLLHTLSAARGKGNKE